MKNLPTILILALAFIHGVNAGKISGSIDSREDEPANGPGDGLMPIPLPINITMNQQLISEGILSNSLSLNLGKITGYKHNFKNID